MTKTDLSSRTNKQDKIATELRREIAIGKRKPGERLPNRDELEILYQASRMTIQKALDQLSLDRFIQARGRLGTYISETPPCLYRYGVVFSERPQSTNWSKFQETVLQVTQGLAQFQQIEIACYFAVNKDHENGDYQKLLDDVRSHRLAHLFYVNNPWFLEKTPLGNQDLVPCTAVMADPPSGGLSHFSAIKLDRDSLFEAGIESLTRKGCKRPAILINSGYKEHLPLVTTALKTRNLPYIPTLFQGSTFSDPAFAGHITALWMKLPAAERPDGIWIADDNLTDHACRGLIQSGIQPGVDLPVSTHCNFPTRNDNLMDIEKVGFDVFHIMQDFLYEVKQHRQNDSSGKVKTYRAVDEQGAVPFLKTGPVPASH